MFCKSHKLKLKFLLLLKMTNLSLILYKSVLGNKTNELEEATKKVTTKEP